tara:strand:+ start:328 stop:897 length:570 start_codon:yes stop_codon:yes gene_type:complete
MSRLLKKLSHKYQFLKLELDDIADSAEDYLSDFNKEFGRYFIDKNSEVWINEETGEIREDPPAPVIKKRKKKDPKLKKLYKKLSTFVHPDKGGLDEDFASLKESYDKNDIFGLINLAAQYDVNVTLDEEDQQLAEKSILGIQKTIENHTNTLAWHYCTGNKAKKLQVLKMVENQLNIKIDPKNYPKELL